MTTYAIGDLQGCLDPLQRLLERLLFDPAHDRLLFTGDLVNRGPQSLQCLRFVRGLGTAAVTVLGNHDLHLLACSHTGRRDPRDRLDDILQAPDREELLGWLLKQPLAYQHPDTGTLLIHAGLPPQWTARLTLQLAAEASAFIAEEPGRFFHEMYGNQPELWQDELQGIARHRCVVNALTRLRYCSAEGRMDLRPKGAPGTQPEGLLPWFQVPGRRSSDVKIICGHWSTIGQLHWPLENVWSLDSGCVWGGCLSALQLETGVITQQGCGQYRRSGVPQD